jgi:hypothetical protein
VKSSLASAVRSHMGLPGSRRAVARLLGVAPAALLLSGLLTVWAGPLAAPVAAAVPTNQVRPPPDISPTGA